MQILTNHVMNLNMDVNINTIIYIIKLITLYNEEITHFEL